MSTKERPPPTPSCIVPNLILGPQHLLGASSGILRVVIDQLCQVRSHHAQLQGDQMLEEDSSIDPERPVLAQSSSRGPSTNPAHARPCAKASDDRKVLACNASVRASPLPLASGVTYRQGLLIDTSHVHRELGCTSRGPQSCPSFASSQGRSPGIVLECVKNHPRRESTRPSLLPCTLPRATRPILVQSDRGR